MDFDMEKWMRDMVSPGEKRPLPVLSFPGIQITGNTVEETVRSGRLQAECMEAIADRFDMAAVLGLMDLSVEAEAFGSPVRYSSQEVPTVTAAIIQEEEEADALQVPPGGVPGRDPAGGRTGEGSACPGGDDRTLLPGGTASGYDGDHDPVLRGAGDGGDCAGEGDRLSLRLRQGL